MTKIIITYKDVIIDNRGNVSLRTTHKEFNTLDGAKSFAEYLKGMNVDYTAEVITRINLREEII